MDQAFASPLLAHFSALEDPRIDRQKKHMLLDVLVIALCSVLCGITSFEGFEEFGLNKEAWLRTFLRLPNGIPSHDTFNRVFARLKPDVFTRCFVAWMEQVVTLTDGEVVAIDGKTLRRSFDRVSSKAAIHMISAFATANGVSLGQLKVEDKTNEINAIPKLLDLLSLKGCLVTIDAMGCQREISEKILAEGADYCLALKDNQPALANDVEDFFETFSPVTTEKTPYQSFEETNKGHGREETRRYFITDEIEEIQRVHNWPGLKSIGVVKSKRIIGGVAAYEERYYIASFPADAKKFAHAVRQHWQVENALHWRLDVVFGEDSCRARKDHAAENLAILRRTALNLLRMDPSKKSVPKKQIKCALNEGYLAKVLLGQHV